MSVISRPSASSEALVLRAWPCGETSSVASLLTRDHGFVKVIAKAARRPQSRLRALVEPGRLVQAEFGLDPHRELQYLRSGSVTLDPMGAEPTLELSAFLLGALELVDRCRPGGSGPSGGVFAICEEFVRVLSSPTCRRPDLVFFALEWNLLKLHGLTPEIEFCAECGRTLAEEGEPALRFSAAEGGVICPGCHGNGAGAGDGPLSGEAWRILVEMDAGGIERVRDLPFSRPLRREIGALLHGFLGYHLPGYRLPAALDLLRTRKD